MTEPVLDCARLRNVLQLVADDLKGRADDLRVLDAQLGDGDLGVTVELCHKAMSEYLAGTPATDIGDLLIQCGLNINRVCPSTFGTILASAFTGGGMAAKGKNELQSGDLVAVGEAAIANIKKRGKAETGDKTVLDAIVPAVESFKAALAVGQEAGTAASAAVRAASEGMEATKNMKAKFGRAKWFQDSSVGVQDGGATAMYYMIASFVRNAF